jgi:phosphoribosylaminoimidazole-succinocarboxamide synthase
MHKNQELPETLVTPTTKAPAGQHDAPITEADILTGGLCPPDIWAEILRVSHALFARARRLCAERGLLLVDTKYEFGLDAGGRLVLADELHTPDGSRLWLAGTYQQRLRDGAEPDSADKEFLRLWVARHGTDVPVAIRDELSSRYRRCYAMVTGRDAPFPAEPDPAARVRATLRKNFPAQF